MRKKPKITYSGALPFSSLLISSLLSSLLLCVLLTFPAIAEGDSGKVKAAHVRASIITDSNYVRNPVTKELKTLRIAILLTIDSGWHIYWRNSGDSGIPTKITWSPPKGWTVSDVRWPAPMVFDEEGGIRTFGYENEVALLSTLSGPKRVNAELITLEASAEFLVCKNICIPGKVTASKTLTLDAQTAEQTAETATDDVTEEFHLINHYDQLTVQAPDVMYQFDLLRQSQVQGLIDVPSVKPNTTFTAALFFPRVLEANITRLSEGIQLFPHQNPNIQVGPGKVGKLQRSEGTSSENTEQKGGPDTSAVSDYLITFPVTHIGDKNLVFVRFTGEVVLSSALLGSIHDLSFPWELDYKLEHSQGEFLVHQELPELLQRVVQWEPLVFRMHGHSVATSRETSTSEVIKILFLAFLGGVLLNFMPCVLPIISIKALAFINNAGKEQRESTESALVFSLGILTSFGVLAIAIVALQSVGYAVGWGFQFQQPLFVFILLVITYVLSLGFFDLYVFHLPYIQEANRAVFRIPPSLSRDFFDGILATALSTPCTAPFLGTALAFAFTQSALMVLAIFLSIGAGLALPYFYLSTHPKLIRLLPKPGPWMNTVKQMMGFLLILTSIWLLYVLESLTGDSILTVLVLLFIIHFATWLRHVVLASSVNRWIKGLFRVSMLAIVACSFFFVLPRILSPGKQAGKQESAPDQVLIAWQPYSDVTLKRARDINQAVFIDFTADWCVTCKVNETFAIETQEVAKAFKAHNILPLKADWTRSDKEITEALARYNARGVPLYVYYPSQPNAEPIILPNLVTSSLLVNTFSKHSK